MKETSEFIRELFFNKTYKKIDDQAIDEILQQYIPTELDLNYEKNRKNKDALKILDIIIRRSSSVADDAKRDVVFKEDLEIMLEYPKEDVSIPFTPIKRLIDENCRKKVSKDGAMLLASKLDDYCIEILLKANENAENNNHEIITVDDLKDCL